MNDTESIGMNGYSAFHFMGAQRPAHGGAGEARLDGCPPPRGLSSYKTHPSSKKNTISPSLFQPTPINLQIPS